MQNARFESEVLRLTNEFRKKNGLDPLVIDQDLEEAADQHTRNMARQDFFAHKGKDGSTPANRARSAGYETGFVGENIAAGYTTPKQVVDGWISSPGHRANMLNANYNEIGIGYYHQQNDTGSVNYRHYWTQVFGKGTIEPVPSAPKKNNSSNTGSSNSGSSKNSTANSSKNTPVNSSKNTSAPREQPAIDITPSTPIAEPTPRENTNPTNPRPTNPRPTNTNETSPRPDLGAIRGTQRADMLAGNGANNVIRGLGGNDKLLGRAGNDQLMGGNGRDRLSGGTGNDVLKGGKGRDVIRGGSGNNRVTGNAGRDIFVLVQGTGQTRVTDFQVGDDRIRLGNNLRLGQIQVRQRGSDTLIQSGDDVLGVLENVNSADITPNSFA
ncbi:MAG: CAP domain-containing protein [Cyanobacteria bacterium J06633_2]